MAGDGIVHAEGGPARHIPVLLEEVAAAVAAKPGDLIVDGTFGAGGYARRILNRPTPFGVALRHRADL